MKILLTETDLAEGVARLAREINRTYGEEPLTIVGVLTGCVVVLADTIRQLKMPTQIGFIQASSYIGAVTRPGQLTIGQSFMPRIEGQNVLLLDDIFDTGHTLETILNRFAEHQPRSLRSAVLLRKRDRAEVTIQPDFVALEIPDQFVVGYGLDYNGAYRHLPHLAVLEPGDLD